MKTTEIYISISSIILSLILSLSTAAFTSSCNLAESAVNDLPTAHYVVGLSTNLSEEASEEALRQTLSLLLTASMPGDRIDVYDAINVRQLITIDLPEKASYQNERVRVKLYASQIAKLKSFLMPEASTQPLKGDSRSIPIPKFLRYVASHGGNEGGRARRIVLIGDVLYHDPAEPAFSMREAFPTDGHLLATDEDTVFAPGGNLGLGNTEVYFAHLGETKYVNDLHALRVHRFWTLWVNALGGTVTGFEADFLPPLRRSLGGERAPTETSFSIDPKDRDIAMIRVDERVVDIGWIRDETPSEVPPITIADVEQQPAGPMPMQIGVHWAHPSLVDLDLYVRPRPGLSELYFENIQNEAGRFVKDYVSEPTAKNGYEFVLIDHVPNPEDVEVWVNLYRRQGSQSTPVRGEVRIYHENRLHQLPISFEAFDGNGGEDRLGDRPLSEFWKTVKVKEVIAMKPQSSE